jgi:hypothetical protein
VLKSFNYLFVYGPTPDPGPLRTPVGWRSVAARWLE